MKLEINSTPQNHFNHYNFSAGMMPEDTAKVLNAGIEFAKEGNRAEARALLMRVTENEPQNESAWLWLASISEYPEELIVFLQRVLEVNPQNERALEWLAATKSLFAKTFVQHGVKALQENRREFARQCFLQAKLNDPQNEDAWLEMALMAESSDEKTEHLERVLSINPANEKALSEMRLIKREKGQQLLKKANSAAVSGKREMAEELLTQVFQNAPDLEDAWLLKAFLAAEFNEKIACYEQVLQSNPANEAARAGVASLRALVQDDESESSEESAELKEFSDDKSSPEPVSATDSFEDEKKNEELPQVAVNAEPEVYAAENTAQATENFTNNSSENQSPELDGEPEKKKTPFVDFSNESAENAIEKEQRFDDGHSAADEQSSDEMNQVSSAGKAENAETDTNLISQSASNENEPEFSENSMLQNDSDISANKTEEFNACPFCTASNESQQIVCGSCRAMLSLADLEMLLAYQEADQNVLQNEIERMNAARTQRGLSVEELNTLALAHLNAKNVRAGLNCLEEAHQINPDDIVLSAKIIFLAIRAAEIEEQAEKSAESTFRKYTIMIVDDSPTIRRLVSAKLEKSGHVVLEATSGADALAKITEAKPDLILLDISMPEMDGYQVCKTIRGNEAMKDVPVLLISGKDGLFDKARGRRAGSTGFISKPFGPETLMKTVETYLN